MTEMIHSEIETGELLLLAGIEEIEKYGLHNMSMRRIAASCGVSCAAPYKHYKNRDEFILAIIKYINRCWADIQANIIKNCGEGASNRRILTEISVGYINFLVDHPNFRSIILMKDDNIEQIKEKASVSNCTMDYIKKYCTEVNMSDEDRVRKVFIIRSLIYGAAFMLDCGELAKSPESYAMIRECIRREFDLM